jgi:PAS domain S-box-containing protein
MTTYSSTYKRSYLGVLAGVALLVAATGTWFPGTLARIASANHLYTTRFLLYRQLLVLHIVSSSVIFVSQLAISFSLGWLVYRERRLVRFAWIVVAFGLFLLACGLGHAMDVVVIWKPLFWLAADIKLVTSIASLATAAVLPFVIPRVGNVLRDAESSRQNELRFFTASNITTDAFFILYSVRNDENEIVDFQFAFVNAHGARLLSRTPESLHGTRLSAGFPGQRTQEFARKYKRVVETGQKLDEEFSTTTANGEEGWFHIRALKLDDGVAVTTTDVSERKENEIKLAETNGRFRMLVEGVKDHALFTMDDAGCVDSWNLGAERLLGYAEPDILGRNFACVFTPDDIKNGVPEQQLQKAVATGQAEDEGWRVSTSGKQFWANVSITALPGDAGPDGGFAVLIQDVTERRKVALALEEATKEAARLKVVVLDKARQERARLQEQFLSHVSHELRTPLTAIYFFVTNLLDGVVGDLTADQREHLQLALDNVKQLKDMVSDLLDITRVDTHKLTVESRHTSPLKLFADVLCTCRTNAAAKNITLRSDVAPGLPFIWADPARSRQILTNLIDNAIKFTPEGGVITLGGERYAEDDHYLRISVSDTGCGINPDNLELIFDRLAQIKGGTEASRSGLGLGLFIARELAARHGGRIWVESKVGEGSTFFFTLPVFSLARLCSRVFKASLLEGDPVTLITIYVVPLGGTAQEDLLLEIRSVLERCIHIGKDVLLPSMSDADPVETFFIVACTPQSGLDVIASRIARELQAFDEASHLKPVISSQILLAAPGQNSEEQASDVMEQIERSIQKHLEGAEIFK